MVGRSSNAKHRHQIALIFSVEEENLEGCGPEHVDEDKNEEAFRYSNRNSNKMHNKTNNRIFFSSHNIIIFFRLFRFFVICNDISTSHDIHCHVDYTNSIQRSGRELAFGVFWWKNTAHDV